MAIDPLTGRKASASGDPGRRRQQRRIDRMTVTERMELALELGRQGRLIEKQMRGAFVAKSK